jgi:hypothetical protein
MNLMIDNTIATQLDREAFERVLNVYPEEEIAKRRIFAEALRSDEIDFEALKEEAGKLIIPWQMFFLDRSSLEVELARIERLRHKASSRLFAKRSGAGSVTSKRILDRLIRCQTYIGANHTIEKNAFCGSLKGRSVGDAVRHISRHLGIDPNAFRAKNKVDALSYLIDKVEQGRINVSQGVLTNKILPLLSDSRNVYKNTSGFVIGDASVPFLFIPSEINPDEREGRQILTLVYLVTLIGLDAYEYQIERDFKASMLRAVGQQRTAYDIVSEFLLPFADTEPFREVDVTVSTRDWLAQRYKLTPSAVAVILRKRKIISFQKYKDLLPPAAPPRPRKGGSTPRVEASVRKFNGKYSYEYINRDFASGKITPVQTQYLLFGSINKNGFRKYKRNLGL